MANIDCIEYEDMECIECEVLSLSETDLAKYETSTWRALEHEQTTLK